MSLHSRLMSEKTRMSRSAGTPRAATSGKMFKSSRTASSRAPSVPYTSTSAS